MELDPQLLLRLHLRHVNLQRWRIFLLTVQVGSSIQLPPRISATQNSITSSSFSQRYGEMIRETVTISQKIGVKFEDSDFVALISEPKITYVPVKVEGSSESG